MAFVASELLSKTESIVERLIDKILQGVSQLRAEVEGMVNNILIKVEDTVEQITQTVTNNLVNPFFQKVDALRKSLVEDVKEVIDLAFDRTELVIDKGDRILTGTIDTFRNEVLKLFDSFPWDMPWEKDSCRKKLNIQGIPGPRLSNFQFYELQKCRTLKRYDEEKEIRDLDVGEIQSLYAGLQDRAWHLACAARGTVTGVSSGLKIEAIEDWIEFGKLHQLWNQFNEDMSILDALNQKVQELDTKIAQFESKSAQLDALSTTMQEVQSTANAAATKADAAQGTANAAVTKANTAQSAANNGVSKADAAQNTANQNLSKISEIKERVKHITSAKGSGHTNISAGKNTLVLQSDGNIVVYRNGGAAIWATGTNN